MIIIEFIFVMAFVFFLLFLGLGAAVWLKLRYHLRGVFGENKPRPQQRPYDENVIEGEYRIIDTEETKK